MNFKAWIAVGVAGFAIGAGVNGLQSVLTTDESPSSNVSQPADGDFGQIPTTLGDGDFVIPEDGEFTLPEGPFTLPDGTIVDLTDGGGTITLPDGSTIDAPPRPNGGFGGRVRPGQAP